MEHKPYGPYEAYIKRPLDICLSFIALIALSPLMGVTSILVKTKLGSPIIFKQPRPGKNEKIFNIYKFRTMTDERDENGELLPDEDRATKFGRLLRSTSIDELPELINILKGDMSIIGPRPLAEQYLPYYSNEERKRHLVRPGLSGLAQINGRTAANWEQRFKYDVEYVESITFITDMRIMFETIYKAVNRSDIVEAGNQGDFDKYRLRQMKEKDCIENE